MKVLYMRRGIWLLTGKMHFFGTGNSDLGLVIPLSARLQQRADCRVLPKLCLRPLSSHPHSSRRFEKTAKPNQPLISHCRRALGGGAGSMGCRILVTDLGTDSEALAELSDYHVQPVPFLEALCQERSISTLDKSLISVLQCCILQ